MSGPAPAEAADERTLLVVAFHYPPDNSSTGVLRTDKFTRYLLGHGWRSHVVTVPERLYLSCNPAGIDPLPAGITVERTWACDVKHAISIRGRYPFFLTIPDRFWPWIVPATRAGCRAAREKRIDALYSTYPHASAHLAALAIRRRTGLPWIADFRDPWIEDSMSALRKRFEGPLERAVVSTADRVVCNTPVMRRAFLAAYPELPADRFVIIENGYDEGDLASVAPVVPPRFELLHPGGLNAAERNPAPLLRGVRRALDLGLLDAADLAITLLGAGDYGRSEALRAEIAANRLDDVVTVVPGRVPYRESLARMAGTSVLVMLCETLGDPGTASAQAWARMQVPAKLYEYLRLGRPLLVLVSEGAARELLETTGLGSAIPPLDTDAIARTLGRLYATRRPPPATLPPPARVIAGYDRRRLTARLAHELDIIAPATEDGQRAHGATRLRVRHQTT